MGKSLSLFAIFILTFLGLVIPFITLTAFRPLNGEHYTLKQESSTDKGINETDFINTMFLCSSFFENGSETNYFINPTLKTSKSLTYNDKGYLDFLKDSYSTGVSYDKSDDEFMDLYKNGDTYAKQYNIDKFYDVDKKQFLKELTNFSYSFINKYNLSQMLNKLRVNITDLQQVNLKNSNGKLISDYKSEFNKTNKKGYIIISYSKYMDENKFVAEKKEISIAGISNDGISVNGGFYENPIIYRWDGVGEPIIPIINPNDGEITDGSFENVYKIKCFLIKYLDIIIQENIRVQQGGSADYENPNKVGTKRIIFDFETVDELDVKNIKKAIYRMILTIDEDKNIVAGSLELTHFKQYWDGYNTNSYRYTDDLGFLFTFMQDKKNIFNFSAETYNCRIKDEVGQNNSY